MKRLNQILNCLTLTVFALLLPAVSWSDSDRTPLLTVEDEETATASAYSKDNELEDVEIFLQTAFDDTLGSSVKWEATLKNGTPLKAKPHHYGNGILYVIPKKLLRKSKYYSGVVWFDLLIHGTQPGWFGKTWLGHYMGLNQKYFHFVQRFYVSKDNGTAWSTTRLLPFAGESMVQKTSYNSDDQRVSTRMRPYSKAKAILVERCTGEEYVPGVNEGTDCTDGIDDSQQASGQKAQIYQQYAQGQSTYSNEQLGAALMLILVAANMMMDPTQAITATPEYEYLYSISNKGAFLGW